MCLFSPPWDVSPWPGPPYPSTTPSSLGHIRKDPLAAEASLLRLRAWEGGGGGGGLTPALCAQCAPGGCLMELCVQLSIIMLGKQLIQNNLFEIGIP